MLGVHLGDMEGSVLQSNKDDSIITIQIKNHCSGTPHMTLNCSKKSIQVVLHYKQR